MMRPVILSRYVTLTRHYDTIIDRPQRPRRYRINCTCKEEEE